MRVCAAVCFMGSAALGTVCFADELVLKNHPSGWPTVCAEAHAFDFAGMSWYSTRELFESDHGCEDAASDTYHGYLGAPGGFVAGCECNARQPDDYMFVDSKNPRPIPPEDRVAVPARGGVKVYADNLIVKATHQGKDYFFVCMWGFQQAERDKWPEDRQGRNRPTRRLNHSGCEILLAIAFDNNDSTSADAEGRLKKDGGVFKLFVQVPVSVAGKLKEKELEFEPRGF